MDATFLDRFLFKDQFIELTTAVPASASLYGLGETTLRSGLLLPRDGTVLTLWNRDLSSTTIGLNLYGSHPFYMQVAEGTSLQIKRHELGTTR